MRRFVSPVGSLVLGYNFRNFHSFCHAACGHFGFKSDDLWGFHETVWKDCPSLFRLSSPWCQLTQASKALHLVGSSKSCKWGAKSINCWYFYFQILPSTASWGVETRRAAKVEVRCDAPVMKGKWHCPNQKIQFYLAIFSPTSWLNLSCESPTFWISNCWNIRARRVIPVNLNCYIPSKIFPRIIHRSSILYILVNWQAYSSRLAKAIWFGDDLALKV